MATVQISDIYNPLVFAGGAQEAQLELNRFIQSGVMVMDERLSGMASTGGNIGELPFFKPLGTDEPNYSNDVPTDTVVPKNITSAKQIYRLTSQNQSWSVMDISRELSLQDPVAAITGRIGQYWATNNERRIISCVRGIVADNIANDNGDMIVDLSVAADGTATDDNLIDADAVIDTVQTMGDHGEILGVIAMHSVPYRRLQKLNLIDFIPDARGEINIPVYQGKRVVIDDSLVGVSYGTSPVNVYYDTILFTQGEFVAGEGRVNVPSELDRKPENGNGGGEERLYSRRSDIIHPLGFQFTSATVAGQSATQAELADASNWDRVFERKNVGLAILRTNG